MPARKIRRDPTDPGEHEFRGPTPASLSPRRTGRMTARGEMPDFDGAGDVLRQIDDSLAREDAVRDPEGIMQARVPAMAPRDNTRALPVGRSAPHHDVPGDVDLAEPTMDREIRPAIRDRLSEQAGRDMDDAVARRTKRIRRH